MIRRRKLCTPQVLWSYSPGQYIADTRGSSARFVGEGGRVQTLPTNQPRDGHWVTSNSVLRRGTYIEGARQNLCATGSARDLTDADWTPSNCTPLKDQTGVDGVANAASSLEATGANATILQAITSASAARITSAYVKRLAGTGTVNMTQDNGATWTAITLTSAWTRVNLAAVTSANPTIGFQIVTSGDKIAVDFVQHELGSWISSPLNAQESRAADVLQESISFLPTDEFTLYVAFTNGMLNVSGATGFAMEIGDQDIAGSSVNVRTHPSESIWQMVARTTASDQTTSAIGGAQAPSIGDFFEIRIYKPASGDITWGVSKNGGTEATTTHAPGTWDATWNLAKISYGCSGAGTYQGNLVMHAGLVIPGAWSMNDMRLWATRLYK